MEFTLPTTKAEMLATLQDIYSYYRISKQGFTQSVLSELILNDMAITELSDDEIYEKANKLVKAKHKRETAELKKSIKEKITALNAKKTAVTENSAALILSINAAYEKSEAKVEREAVKKGFAQSNVVIDKLAELEAKRNAEISAATGAKNTALSEIDAEIAALNTSLTGADTYYSDIHADEVAAKASELKDAQNKDKREVFRYNNELSEKRQKYANRIKEINMNYQLKFMEIKSTSFTKEQLFEMGYFKDVTTCICAYYDLMDATDAYTEITNESSLIFFLDDYYPDVVYMYKMRMSQTTS